MKSKTSPVLWVSFAMIVGMMGTALISPLYGLYKASWNLQASDISLIYAIYMVGVLFSLLALGRLSDRLGFRTVLLASVVLALVGTVWTIFSPNMAWLSVGRFIVGVASGVATTAGTVALNALTPPEHKHKLSLITSLLIAAGFGIGPLIGGGLGQFAPHPLIVPYIPTLVCGVIAILALLLAVPDVGRIAGQRLRLKDILPKLTSPEPGRRVMFFLICGSPFVAFGVFGLFASMTPLLVEQMMHLSGPLVSGLSVTMILVLSSIAQILAQRLKPLTCQILGLGALVLSNVALLVNLSFSSSVIFGIGVVLTAIGHGLSLLASMKVLNAMASEQNRAGLTSTYMVIGYCGAIIPVLGVGWIADHWGLDSAVTAFCAAVITVSLLLIAGHLMMARKKAA